MDLIVYALLKSKLDKASSEINSKINVLEDDINNKIAILDAGLTPIASKNGDITKDAVTAEAWERLNNESVDVFAVVDGVVVKATYSKNQNDEIEIRTNDRLICTISEEGNEFSIDWNSFYTDVDVNVVQSGLLGEEINLRNGEGSESLRQVGGAEASGNYSIALGIDTVASGLCSFASGYASIAGEAEAHAEGSSTEANGYASHAEGGYTSVTSMSDYAHAEGYGTTANQPMAHAEGEDTTADGRAAHAEGCDTLAGGINSHAGGTGTVANTNSMFAGGVYNVRSSQFQQWNASTSYAVGDKVIMLGEGYICTTANSDSQFDRANWQAVGYSGDTALAIGNGTSDNNRSNAMRLDWDGNLELSGGVTLGKVGQNGVSLTANELTAIKNVAPANVAIWTHGASGINNYQTVGGGAIATGNYAHAEGYSEGGYVGALGIASHVEGYDTIAEGNYSHAENGGRAYGIMSHAENGGEAYGYYSHAEGEANEARGEASHAEGFDTKVYGYYSHVEGECTIASGKATHVGGRYNIDINGNVGNQNAYYGDYAEIIGNGEHLNPSNARALDWSGNEYLAGDIYVNCDENSANGTKLVSETDYATDAKAGVVKSSSSTGISINANGYPVINNATTELIKEGTNIHRPITPSNQYISAFYGLAKAAGDTTQSQSSNAIGTYTDGAKTAIKNMLGVATASDKTTYSIVNDAATNIQINGTAATLSDIISKNVGTIEVTQDGSTYIFEIVESGTNKVYVCNYANSHAAIIPVANDATSLVPTWYDKYERIYVQYNESTEVATVLNDSVATVLLNANIPTIVILTFVGDTSEKEYTLQRTEYQPNYSANSKLVKYSNAEFDNTSDEKIVSIEFGDSAISSVVYSNTEPLGDYVQKTDYASSSAAGVAKVGDYGIAIIGDNVLRTKYASSSKIKVGNNGFDPIVPNNQHESTFYGLAKAAGDTTQSQSSNAVGTYTSEAKTAIQSMLGIQEVLGGSVVEISESDPVITATLNTQYICGEVATLSFTPYQIGVSDVIFTSGSTPTVLTLPNTVKMPEWFTIEANRVYEINVSNGIYGSVMSWAN